MATITTEDFFKERRSTSEIKSEIFVKYFKFWCGVLLFGQQYRRIEKLLYIDLFSGPGYYGDGKVPSTPIKILESICNSDGKAIDLNRAVHTFFNDEKKKLIHQLESNILSLPDYDKIINKPILLNKSANINLLMPLLEKGTPSLTFIDPFGYSYSMKMLLSAVKEWGSDLFMLFNINRIRAAIKNPNVEPLMNQIFEDRIDALRTFYLKEKSPSKREQHILTIFETIFKERGYFVFKFKINFPDRNATSHYLILVTKVKLAFSRLKK